MRIALGTLLATCLVSPALAGGLAIVGTELRDNGDHDGYADTNETVELWLTVENTTSENLTAVTIGVSMAEGRTACILDGTSSIGTVPAGGRQRALDPIVFHVASDQDRGASGLTPFDVFVVSFDLTVQASPTAPPAHPSRLTFDLDLDVAGGGAPSTLTEGFESGLGIFAVQNLDLGLHDDGWEINASTPRRCQYHIPVCGAVCQGVAAQCSLGGTAAAADAIWWQVDAGRSYVGDKSLYFGQALGGGYTTPTGALEAVATTVPIHIANGRHCSNGYTVPCTDDAACAPGGVCADVVPTLSFKHQISLLDNRTISNVPVGDPGQALDRGIVSIQLADAYGAPAGPWMRLEPSINVHDAIATSAFANCSFDPIDDGNDEDDVFPPALPVGSRARRGPSSTCADQPAFVALGSTAGPFSPTALARADGPGLQGAIGPGTWVQTWYDLSRYRGRSVRIRFLATTTRVGTPATYQEWGLSASNPGDDGWWIDDVSIWGAAPVAATMANDTHDNSALAPDGDDDGVDDFCDNCALIVNAGQADTDADGFGDACDACTDTDGDGTANPGHPASTCAVDNCPAIANPTQEDSDLDGVGSACDNCPLVANPSQANADGDPAGDVCDCTPNDAGSYPNAVETNDGLDNNCPGDAGFGLVDELTGTIGFFDPTNKNVLSWPAQPGATQYFVTTKIGTTSQHASGSWCFGFVTGSPSHDTQLLNSGIRFYLVRPHNPFGGSLGASSAGVERRLVACAAAP